MATVIFRTSRFYITIFCLGLEDSDQSDTESKKKTQKQDKKKNKKALKEAAQDEGEDHPLITDLDWRDKDQKRAHRAELWFERDAFKNLIDENDEDADLDKMVENYKQKGAKIIENTSVEIKKVKKKEVSSDSDYSSDESSDDEYDVEKEYAKNNPKSTDAPVTTQGNENLLLHLVPNFAFKFSYLVLNR